MLTRGPIVLVLLLSTLAAAASAERAEVRVLEGDANCHASYGFESTVEDDGTTTTESGTYESSKDCWRHSEYGGATVESLGTEVVFVSAGHRESEHYESEAAYTWTNSNAGCPDDDGNTYACELDNEEAGTFSAYGDRATFADARVLGEGVYARNQECTWTSEGGYTYEDWVSYAGDGEWDWFFEYEEQSTYSSHCRSYVAGGGQHVTYSECDRTLDGSLHNAYGSDGTDVWETPYTSTQDCFLGARGGGSVSGTGTAADGSSWYLNSGRRFQEAVDCSNPAACSTEQDQTLLLGAGFAAAGGWFGAGGEMPLP